MYNISLLLPLFDVYVTGERLDYRLLTKAISTSWGVTFTFSLPLTLSSRWDSVMSSL